MKIVAIMWDALCPVLKRASEITGVPVEIFGNRRMDSSEEIRDSARISFQDADVIVSYHTTHGFWTEIDDTLRSIGKTSRIICVGQDPNVWSISNVEPSVCTETYRYLLNGNEGNFARLLNYLSATFDGSDRPIEPAAEIPWQGLVHPSTGDVVFGSLEEFRSSVGIDASKPTVGIVMSRGTWLTGQRDIETGLIHDLESEGLNVIPMISHSLHNEEMGMMNIAECIERFLVVDGKPVVDAMIKLVTFMIGKIPELSHRESAEAVVCLLKDMNVPFFQPIISYNLTPDQWRESDGLGPDIGWSITMPEFEGMIEPIFLGSGCSDDTAMYGRTPIPERSALIARRVAKRISTAKKDPSERRVVLILNNNPCASVEANIGSAAGLDAMESAVRVLRSLKDAGYDVDPPESAEVLADLFRSHKATSEFRWTSKQEIFDRGGALYRMRGDEYRRIFDGLPEDVKCKMTESWGDPPGESMVLDGDILITGLRFGNAIVAVQPKRGCYGPRCDGTVCKILHDPSCPPTHQYVATYRYFTDIFEADALIHVGTHGTLEFLPGKSTGLSESCYPSICAGDVPLLYIYNTDNPPEGTIAKRRGNATLVGHMQTPMSAAGLYGAYEKLDSLLAQYETAKEDGAREHALQHMILDAIDEAGIDEIGADHDTPMEEIIRRCHEKLSEMRNTRIENGMHIFGTVPEKKKLVDTVVSAVRYDPGDGSSFRHVLAGLMGLDYAEILSDPGSFNGRFAMSNGGLMELVDARTETAVRMCANGCDDADIAEALSVEPTERFTGCLERIRDVISRVRGSDEIGALLNALDGGFVPPGPSGYMTRGRDDVLPTGRNFYSLDPKRVPTTSSWRVGTRLADALIEKYRNDEGSYPESIAFQWMANDVMAADGEMMAEIMSVIGTVPVWSSNGQVSSFDIIPIDEMTHPRIDVTIRMSGILRDSFPGCVDLLDSAISAVASLDEDPDENHIRKHVLRDMESGATFEEATSRIFSSKPGTYTSGVSLAVLSGAWRTEKDLAEIYIVANGYAYGNGRNGKASHPQFASDLENVSVTFNKVVTDDHDLLGCCCYYSNQGGMTAAARHLSNGDVKTYFGDTREHDSVSVRTLSDEIRRVVRSKVLNPKWIDGMKDHGYKGAADMMKRIVRVYGWEAATQEVDDEIFDDIAETYVNDPVMKNFFETNNPYAAEEISRRLLEAESRGLWDADPEVLDKLRESYLEIESWMEDDSDGGDCQGGNVDIMSPGEIDGWGDDIVKIMESVHRRRR